MDRKLTGIFIRVKTHEDRYEAKDISDCTEDQILKWLERTDSDKHFLKGVVVILAETIRNIGNQLDIRRETEGDEDDK